MKIKFLGAAGTVTGSKTLVNHAKNDYLVDCGLFQGPKVWRNRNWDVFPGADEIKSIFLTHAHLDHSGYIPKIVKEGFKGHVYCSEGTLELSRLLLRDAGRLQEEDARFANRTGYSHHKPALPLYDEVDALSSLNLFTPMTREDWHPVGEDLKLQLLRSGHIIGSSFVRLGTGDRAGGKVITFTGDLGSGRSPTLKPPVPIFETDYLVLESTYGNRRHPAESPLEGLEKAVNKIVGRGGVLVIPAFSVGRTQDILFLLKQLEDQNRVPHVPVYLDSPMAGEATNVYLKHAEDHIFVLKNGRLEDPLSTHYYRTVPTAEDSKALNSQKGPMIIVSAAGMLTGGRVMHHLARRLPDPRNGVLFVGYQAEGTKGRLLQNGIKSLRIHHVEIPVEAEIMTMDSLSAHADADETLAWLRQLKRPPETIFINHGEPEASAALAERIKTELRLNVCVPELGQEYKLSE